MTRELLCRKLVIEARLRRRAFFCNALAGNSQTNIAINSDLTVSCACHDADGSAHVGDLKRESLAEIFAGETAGRFRDSLPPAASLHRSVPAVPIFARCPGTKPSRRRGSTAFPASS